MKQVNWENILKVVQEHTGQYQQLTSGFLKELIELHGWEALGTLIDAGLQESKIQTLVKAGVPFDEVMKAFKFYEIQKGFKYYTP